MSDRKRTRVTFPDGTETSVEDKNSRYTHAVVIHCSKADRWELVRWSGSDRAIRSWVAKINEEIRTGKTTSDKVLAIPVVRS